MCGPFMTAIGKSMCKKTKKAIYKWRMLTNISGRDIQGGMNMNQMG